MWERDTLVNQRNRFHSVQSETRNLIKNKSGHNKGSLIKSVGQERKEKERNLIATTRAK